MPISEDRLKDIAAIPDEDIDCSDRGVSPQHTYRLDSCGVPVR